MYIVRKAGYAVRDGTHDAVPGDAELEALRRKYLKGYGEKEEKDSDLEELELLLSEVLRAMRESMEIDPRVPDLFRQPFERDMANFEEALASSIAGKYQEGIEAGETAGEALKSASGVLYSGMKAMAAKLDRYKREFDAYVVLLEQERQGYGIYLFVSELGETTCEKCTLNHGRLLEMRNLVEERLITPLHPNCRCELVVMDEQAGMLYNMHREAFLSRLERAIGERERNGRGGIYLLDHNAAIFFGCGIPSQMVSRLTDQDGYILFDLSKPFWYEEPHMLPDTWGQLKEMLVMMAAAQEYRSEHKYESFGSFLNWLTLGIPSGMWSAQADRFTGMVESESFGEGLYHALDFITFGTTGMIAGAIEPEEEYSLQHWLDMLGTALLVYGLYRSVAGSGAADDAARGGSGLSQSKIDEILDISKGQRPDPSTYLSQSYVDDHLANFKDGVTKFYAEAPTGTAGPKSGTFVMPSSVADDIIRQAGGSVSVLEELLGLPAGSLGSNPVRVDIPSPSGLRIPSGNERGTNSLWIPGGYTRGGIIEAVIDPPDLGQYIVTSIK